MHFIIQSIITNNKRPLEKNSEVIRNAIGQFVCMYVIKGREKYMNLNNTIIGRPTQRPTYSRFLTPTFLSLSTLSLSHIYKHSLSLSKRQMKSLLKNFL